MLVISKLFVLARLIQPFRFPLKGWLLTLHTKIRLGWKGFLRALVNGDRKIFLTLGRGLLTFIGQARRLPQREVPPPPLITNIRLGLIDWKGANTLAYLASSTVMLTS